MREGREKRGVQWSKLKWQPQGMLLRSKIILGSSNGQPLDQQ